MEYIVIILICAFLGIGFFLNQPNWQDPKSTQADAQTLQAYEARPSLFVNASERALFSALIRHKPDKYFVMSKVRLEDILQVKGAIKHGRLRWQYRGRIKSRHVDFIICDAEGRFLCALELDGKSHKRDVAEMVDGFKDAIFQYAGLSLLRVQTGVNFDQFSKALWQKIEEN